MHQNVLQNFLDERISSLYQSIPVFNQFTGLFISIKIVGDFFLFKLSDKSFSNLILYSIVWVCFALMLSFFFSLFIKKQVILLKISFAELLLRNYHPSGSNFLSDYVIQNWKIELATKMKQASTQKILLLILSFVSGVASSIALISLQV